MKFSEPTSSVNPAEIENSPAAWDPFFALLAAYMPFSALFGFMSLLVLLLENHYGKGAFPLSHWAASALFSAVAASIYWSLMKKSKADHTAANIRGAVLTVIFTYCLASLFSPDRSLAIRFFPSLFNVPSGLAALLVWSPVISVKKVFDDQLLFRSYTRLYEGEKLREIMLEDSSIMSEVNRETQKTMRRYGFSFLPSLILLLCCGFLNITLNPALVILLVILFVLAASITGFLMFLRREYVFATEGLTLTDRSRALGAAMLVILAAAGAGLLLSSEKSILPPGLILAFLRFLWALLRSLFPAPDTALFRNEIPEFQSDPQGLPPELLELIGEHKPWPFWDWIKYGALAGLAFLFIMFMIHPLLSRSRLFRGAGTLPGRIIAFFRTWFASLFRIFIDFFKSLKFGTAANHISPSAEILRGLKADILEAYSPARKRELARSISLFARIIYWGTETLKVPWKPTHAPLEYCGLLAGKNGDRTILRAGTIFEKSLYSDHPLSREELKEFRDLAESITKI